jgi:diaminohydroxyphosphoribosylaminopyrimidine deaminase/5-amino-6-(5-phosphoribosylamino)uracil reductase
MYVTLEPCCHVGRTQPCTKAIKNAGIARVFVGSIDPNPLVCGAGIEFLNRHHIPTFLVQDPSCERTLEPFKKFIQAKQPWVHLKVASTLDGQLATQSGSSKWITGPEARLQAHRIRAQSDGVLVGLGTVIADDPMLDVRDVPGSSPIPIVLDSKLRIFFD